MGFNKRGKLKEKKKQAFLTDEELDKIIKTATIPRDYLLLNFLRYTGMRVGEVVQIRKKDIHFKDRLIIIGPKITKTKRERHRVIAKPLFKLLKRYCDMIGDEDSVLFPITIQRVWQIVKDHTNKAKINKPVHPHTFRHSLGTYTYKKTGDIKKVAHVLGHRSLASSDIYTHLTDEDGKKIEDELWD